jgi:hypothetical protein
VSSTCKGEHCGKEGFVLSLTTTYFQFKDKFYQKKSMAIGNSLSLVVSNIVTENCEQIALDTADHKPMKWLTYVDNNFVVWPHGPADFPNFFTITAVLDLPSYSQWKLKLMILFHSWISWSLREILKWP